MLSILIIFLSFPSIVLSTQSFKKLQLPSPTMGADSFAFDSLGKGPYTGIADGRILKYYEASGGFADFAVTSPNRSRVVCDGTNNNSTKLGNQCGRPLGLGFNKSTGDLYIADAYQGLLVVGRNGGLSTQLATSADGVPFGFLSGLDVDQQTGHVYFTDVTSVYKINDFPWAVAFNDSTGRLLKYDPKTNKVTVLLTDLLGATGTAISADGSFVLITEFTAKRIIKYWLKGPKADTSEVIIHLNGRPNKVKRVAKGEFLVSINIEKGFLIPELFTVPTAIRLNANARIMEKKSLRAQYNTKFISEVQEFGGALYVGSMFTDFVGVYKPGLTLH
ncbi:hypothetical protein LWI29_019610 [Acer saccharum]|uniref:Strictosidine synthase conserved region domain-containing protein n=1 Tax=Acer saccharum TaxID=4024 RepID=A0AA39S8G4_ACESA|nr:hypothetical protein LWI29_019610 [Acer saccharum]